MLPLWTETDEDVIFVSEKCSIKSKKIAVDKAKRLDLQRDIDQQSQPREQTKPLKSQQSVAVGMAKVKAEKKKKSTKEQASPSVKKSIAAAAGNPAEGKKDKKKVKKNGNDKEVSQKKKLKTAQLTSVTEEVEESPRKLKKTTNRSVQNVKQNEEEDEEPQCRKDKEEKEPKKNKKVEEASVEVSKVKEKEPKKKKKRKVENSKGEEEEQLILNEVEEQSIETVDPDTTSKKKNKNGSSRVETKMKDLSSGTGAKKRKIKEEVEHPDESTPCDVVFLSKKAGNTDEVTINQERRLALQMEIDKASQPQKSDKPLGVGQWGTAQFNSSEQQQKFLRLMGGFKKGFQPAVGSSDRANMALGKDAQQQLQQGLLGEFECAQSRRMDVSSRGSGLGFSAPANKKFSIDINACRSVRFDD
ncbi:knop1 [Pungitius sinensis]